MCEVSIIVPIYNVEKYVSRCIESLIEQTFNNIEIIAINDGSTDKSLEILKKYSNKDKRIVLINKKNEGLSQARNVGIDNSSGKYITFIDSDDWINKDYIEILYNKIIEQDCDVSMCSYIREYEYKSIPKTFKLKEEYIKGPEETRNYLYRRIVGPIGDELEVPEDLDSFVTAWGKLYKTSILKDNHIKFVDTKLIGTEDCLFNIYVFKKMKKATIVNKPLYHYWKGNINSLTSGYKPTLNEQWILNEKYIKEHLDKYNEEKVFYIALNNRICLSVLGLGLNECSKANKISNVKKINNLKKILDQDNMKLAYKSFELKKLPIHWRAFHMFNKYRIAIGAYIILKAINILRKVK